MFRDLGMGGRLFQFGLYNGRIAEFRDGPHARKVSARTASNDIDSVGKLRFHQYRVEYCKSYLTRNPPRAMN
jgi:hypothetical protein